VDWVSDVYWTVYFRVRGCDYPLSISLSSRLSSHTSVGLRPVFNTGIALFALTFVLFPLKNVVILHATELPVRPLIMLQLVSISISDMAFSKFPVTHRYVKALKMVPSATIFMYVSSAVPKRALSATNGLAQTAVSIQRTVGPAAATALFAYSLGNNVMGGNFAYAVLLPRVYTELFVVVQLLSKLWRHNGNCN
jgi:hypothetical protein